jgi:hypothetical protein
MKGMRRAGKSRDESGEKDSWLEGCDPHHPRATMQNPENEGVAGGATGEVVENKGTGSAFGLKNVTPAVFVRVRNKGLAAYGEWNVVRGHI